MASVIEKFNSSDTNGKADLTWAYGEYISSRTYYQLTVSLYTLPGFIVEVSYSPFLNKIINIEIVTDTKRLESHLEHIEISDLNG